MRKVAHQRAKVAHQCPKVAHQRSKVAHQRVKSRANAESRAPTPESRAPMPESRASTLESRAPSRPLDCHTLLLKQTPAYVAVMVSNLFLQCLYHLIKTFSTFIMFTPIIS